MVYESDFYTTRRPYSRVSPTISSYSVTTFPKIPYVAIKRITVPITVTPHGKVRRSVVRGALDRIRHRSRPHVGSSAEDDFLNARASVNFDDTIHSIRAQTAALLKRVHTPIPHAVRPLPISSIYKYIETPIPERIESSAYIDLMLMSPNERVRRDVVPMSHYPQTTHQRNLFGGGRLACVSFAAGRVYPRRKLMLFDENNYRNVRNDVQYLSYYNKTRAEVEKQHPKIKLDEEAKLQWEPIIIPAHPTHTHVSFQTPLKTEEPIIKPNKTTEPLYSDEAENIFQKEEEIDAWLTHQKKKKSKQDAENNENLLNEELAANEALTQAKQIQPEVESEPIQKETQAEELATEIEEPEKKSEILLEELKQEVTQELEEEVLIKKAESVETLNEPESPVKTVSFEVDEPITKEEENNPPNEEITKEEVESIEQEEVSIKPEEQNEAKEEEELAKEQEVQIDESADTTEQKEPITNEVVEKEEEREVEKEPEQIHETEEEEDEEDTLQEELENQEKQPEEEVKVEENVETEEEKDVEIKETEVEPESVKEETKLEHEEDKNEDTADESVQEEVCEEDVDKVTENEILADKSVTEIIEASKDKDCSTYEHKDNDGPKTDTEVSDLEDDCAVPEKVSVKDTLNPATIDTNLDDSSLVDDVFEAPEAPAENKTQPEVTTDEEECEEDSE